MGDQEVDDISRHQLSHREVFLSRQYENINANTIRSGGDILNKYNSDCSGTKTSHSWSAVSMFFVLFCLDE